MAITFLPQHRRFLKRLKKVSTKLNITDSDSAINMGKKFDEYLDSWNTNICKKYLVKDKLKKPKKITDKSTDDWIYIDNIRNELEKLKEVDQKEYTSDNFCNNIALMCEAINPKKGVWKKAPHTRIWNSRQIKVILDEHIKDINDFKDKLQSKIDKEQREQEQKLLKQKREQEQKLLKQKREQEQREQEQREQEQKELTQKRNMCVENFNDKFSLIKGYGIFKDFWLPSLNEKLKEFSDIKEIEKFYKPIKDLDFLAPWIMTLAHRWVTGKSTPDNFKELTDIDKFINYFGGLNYRTNLGDFFEVNKDALEEANYIKENKKLLIK